jgi:hypothetical protein
MLRGKKGTLSSLIVSIGIRVMIRVLTERLPSISFDSFTYAFLIVTIL